MGLLLIRIVGALPTSRGEIRRSRSPLIQIQGWECGVDLRGVFLHVLDAACAGQCINSARSDEIYTLVRETGPGGILKRIHHLNGNGRRGGKGGLLSSKAGFFFGRR